MRRNAALGWLSLFAFACVARSSMPGDAGRGDAGNADHGDTAVSSSPSSLAFVDDEVTLVVDECSFSPLRVELRDASGAPATAAAEISVVIASDLPAVTFHADGRCSSVASSTIAIPAGQTGAAFFVLGRQLTSGHVDARADSLVPATTDVAVIVASPWVREIDPSSGSDLPRKLRVDDTGVYVVGNDSAPGHRQWRIEKLALDDGATLWSHVVDYSTGDDGARAADLTSTALFVGGYDQAPGDNQWRIERRDPDDGGLIWERVDNLSDGDDQVYALRADGGAVYAAGRDSTGGTDTQWRIQKRSASDGSLLWEVVRNTNDLDDNACAAALDATGLYVGGYTGGVTAGTWRVEKLRLTDGETLWEDTVPTAGLTNIRGSAVDATGVYFAGYDQPNGPGNDYQWRVAKHALDDGALIWSEAVRYSAGEDLAVGVAVDHSGVYIAGKDRVPVTDQRWRLEKWNLDDGSVLWEQVADPSGESDGLHGIAVDWSGVYIAGWQRPDDDAWRIEKRRRGDGTP